MASRLWDTMLRFHREVVLPDVARIVDERMNRTLMRFHREVVLPDVERIVAQRIDERVGPLRNEMLTGFDRIYKRFDRLESEFDELNAAMIRVGGRVVPLEENFDQSEG